MYLRLFFLMATPIASGRIWSHSPNPMLDRPIARPAVASQTQSLSCSPRFEVRRMRNANGRKTPSVAVPTTRIAAYLEGPSTSLLLRLDAFARISGEYFEFPAVEYSEK